MSGFPAQYCRVVASRREGDDAVVLLDTGSNGVPYLYVVMCERKGDSWIDGMSGNCLGWASTDPVGEPDESDAWEEEDSEDPARGTLTLWDEAPPGADMVRVEFEGTTIDAPVHDGVYLLAWWKVPCPQEHPRAVAFRIRGEWTPAPRWPS